MSNVPNNSNTRDLDLVNRNKCPVLDRFTEWCLVDATLCFMNEVYFVCTMTSTAIATQHQDRQAAFRDYGQKKADGKSESFLSLHLLCMHSPPPPYGTASANSRGTDQRSLCSSPTQLHANSSSPALELIQQQGVHEYAFLRPEAAEGTAHSAKLPKALHQLTRENKRYTYSLKRPCSWCVPGYSYPCASSGCATAYKHMYTIVGNVPVVRIWLRRGPQRRWGSQRRLRRRHQEREQRWQTSWCSEFRRENVYEKQVGRLRVMGRQVA